MRPSSRVRRDALWFLLYAAVAGLVAIGGLSATTGHEDKAGIASMVRGTAHRPYVYRQLVPLCIRGIQAAWSPERWSEIGHTLVDSGAVGVLERATRFRYTWWESGDVATILLGGFIDFLCLLGFAWALRALLRNQFRGSEPFFQWTPAIAVALIVFMNREGVYCYDCPQLMLFTLALLFLARGSWPAFYPVLALATLNKETSVLLIVVFAAHYWRTMPRRIFFGHLAGQCAVFGSIILVLHRAFAANPGGTAVRHLFDHNVRLLLNPPDDYGAVALGFIVIAFLVHGWNAKPAFLRRASVIFWPLLLLTLLFGWLDELRDYYEFYVIAVPLAAMTVARDVFGAKLSAGPGQAGR